MSEPMRFLSFGAGAIGTYIGGSLVLAGHTVVFLERPEAAAAIRQRGLQLQLLTGSHHIPQPELATTLSQALQSGPFDCILFALKSFDTQNALQEMAAYATELPPVLSLQNGVENETRIAAVLGPDKVISGTITSAIGRRAAGDIVLERFRGMGVAAHPLAPRLLAAFNQAGLNAHFYPHAAAMKWSKMLTNLLANASSAILNMTPAEVFAHPGLYRLELAQLRETLAVMAKLNIPVVDLPGTPVRLLAFGIRRLPARLSQPLLRRAIGRGRGGKMPSFYIDLHSGRGQSEVDDLNGAVVRFAEKAGLQAPVNACLNELLLKLTRGELPLEEFDHQPDKLIAYCTVP